MPEFDGLHDPEAFLDWIEAIERIFAYKRYDERKRFKFAVHSLTEHASYWYERLKARRRMEGKQKIQSWEKLKKHLKRKFLPKDYEQKLYFQRIKSQIVRRKQEERKRLLLDPRNPPKPAPIQESDPPESILASIDKILTLLKEYQEEIAAKTPLLREDEPQVDPNQHASLPNQPTLEDMEEANEESMGEEHEQDTTPMASEEEEEDHSSPRPSMDECTDQETDHQPAPYTFNETQCQQAQLNLRANSFQEREVDAGARGPKHKTNKVQQPTRKKGVSRRPTKPMIKNVYTSNNKLEELRYQDVP